MEKTHRLTWNISRGKQAPLRRHADFGSVEAAQAKWASLVASSRSVTNLKIKAI